MADPPVNTAHQLARQGAVLAGRGDLPGAIGLYRQAIAVWPGFAEAHASIGSLLAAQGQYAPAVECFRTALRLKPDFPQCQFTFAQALLFLGDFAAAQASYRIALQHHPRNADAFHGLGIACKSLGKLDEALSHLLTAVALQPSLAQAHANLGGVYELLGRHDEALAALDRALALQPADAEMHFCRGCVLANLHRFADAAAAYRQALSLQPGHFNALNNLGIACRMLGDVDAAVACFRQALAVNAADGAVWMNLGVLLDLKGERGAALDAHRRAVAAAPQDHEAHSNLLYALHFHPAIDPQVLLAQARAWDQALAAPLRLSIAPHANDPAPDRRLRIGYVSPDFRDHPVGRFMLPLIAAHDPAAVEVCCYADLPREDEITAAIRRHAAVWRPATGMTDDRLAALIRQDQIDILVDLTMHMAANRLLVFARKPAPVQVTYLAYCSTTGLGTMDYRFSDPYLDPPGADVSCYSEQTLRLPQYWCYAGSPRAPLPAPPPHEAAGPITFGCLNGFSKVSDEALAAWAQVLRAVPGSQLLLHANPGDHRQRIGRQLQAMGVEPGRCTFTGLAALGDYFAAYHRLDIALDPFPYAGGTTTCDALWMGVPVVTRAGRRAVGRGGVSILTALGLPEWIAGTPEQYVQIAAQLAGAPAQLRHWRTALRPRMSASPLMDAPNFARGVEAAYRTIWQKWCGANAP